MGPSALSRNCPLGSLALAAPLAASQPLVSSRSAEAINPRRPGLEQLVDRLLADGAVGAVLVGRGAGRRACGTAARAQEPRCALARVVARGAAACGCHSHAGARRSR